MPPTYIQCPSIQHTMSEIFTRFDPGMCSNRHQHTDSGDSIGYIEGQPAGSCSEEVHQETHEHGSSQA